METPQYSSMLLDLGQEVQRTMTTGTTVGVRIMIRRLGPNVDCEAVYLNQLKLVYVKIVLAPNAN